MTLAWASLVYFSTSTLPALTGYIDTAVLKSQGLESYFNDSKLYSLHYPSIWKIETSSPYFDLYLSLEKEVDQKRTIGTFSILSLPIDEKTGLNEYFRENIKGLLSQDPKTKITGEGISYYDTLPGLWILYERSEDKSKTLHHLLFHHGNAILITASASIEMYELYTEAFESILKSLHLHPGHHPLVQVIHDPQ